MLELYEKAHKMCKINSVKFMIYSSNMYCSAWSTMDKCLVEREVCVKHDEWVQSGVCVSEAPGTNRQCPSFASNLFSAFEYV